METSCTYVSETMYVSTDERRMINRILRLAEANPGQVDILARPENNDGCLYCKLPSKWLRIAPPVKRELTDEQRAEMAERLRNCRK